MADWHARLRRTQKFVVDNFLPLAFLVAIVWSLAWPAPGKAVVGVTVLDGDVHLIQEINIVIVFFISGLVLKTEDLSTALRHKLGVTFGMLSILFVTPCLGFALREIPLQPREFAAGLALFSAVPTTLGVGVSLVRSCGGNEGLALLLTVASNLLGIVTMPVWLKALLGSDKSLESVSVDIPNLLARLSITILAPSVIGKLLRELPPFSKRVKAFTRDWKTFLSLFSVFNLSMIVWQSLSGARNTLVDQQFVQILYVILLAIAQHLIYLAANFAAIWYIFRMPLLEAIATGIMSSQKSAPVAVTVISYLTSNVAQQGLMVIPCVVGQISQIFIGSGLARYFAPRVEKHKQQQKEAAMQHAASSTKLDASAKGDTTEADTESEEDVITSGGAGKAGSTAAAAGAAEHTAVAAAEEGRAPAQAVTVPGPTR